MTIKYAYCDECGHQVAIYWYRQAAEQGYVSAQVNLGYMYKEGLGVPQDYV